MNIAIDKESDGEDKELISVLKRLEGFKEKVESLMSIVA